VFSLIKALPRRSQSIYPPIKSRLLMNSAGGNSKNGELLRQAENDGFEVLVTTDQNLKYQQNLAPRKIGIVVLTTTSWPRIRKHVATVVDAVGSATPSSYIEIAIP
jgi:hypothetical protein